MATASLRRSRRPNAEPITTLIIQGRLSRRDLRGDGVFAANCRMLARAYGGKTPRRRHLPVIALFAAVERESAILSSFVSAKDKIVELLLRMATRSADWVRPVEAWRPASEGGLGQLDELGRHLFERYPPPRFLRWAWWPSHRGVDWMALAWYLHVAPGGSLRTLPGLPVRLSPLAAHEMAGAPVGVAPLAAVCWGQARAAGVAPHLAHALLATAAATASRHNNLWLALFDKLAHAPTLDARDVRPLVDHVAHCARRAEARGGDAFSLKGRTIASLLRAMGRAQTELEMRRLAAGRVEARWPALAGVAPMVEERSDETWVISELLAFRDLYDEGCRMRHCAAVYASACLAGGSSIWSLRIQRGGRERGRVTLRIEVERRSVVEARTVANGAISRDQHRFIAQWAAQNRLEMGALVVAK